MSATIVEIFDPLVERGQLEEAVTTPRKRVTRTLMRNDQVLDYETFTISNCTKCTYFQSIMDCSENAYHVYNFEDIENFILNISLPLPVTGSLQISSRKRRFGEKTLKFPAPIGMIEETIAGSTSEGLWLPQMTHIRGSTYYTDTPDEDKKYIFTELVVSSKRDRAFAEAEPSQYSPKTFVNLKFNERFLAAKHVSGTKILNPRLFVRQDGLIDRNKFVRQLRSVLKSHIHNFKKEQRSFKCKEIDPKVTFSQHGPAITVEVEDVAMKQMISTDYVVCLPCPQWPEQAKGWTTRTRKWPDTAVVRKIARQGCHIVPKPFKPGKLRDTEFIFSFSICDKILSQYLSLNQKRCYMLFKYLFKYCIARVSRGLTSYHCKTTFFWVCERKPSVDWKEHNVTECVKWLLETLVNYLRDRNLPHYYISENNLICEMSETSVAACIKDVESVFESPAKFVLSIAENHRLSFLSRDVSLQNLLQPLSESSSTTTKLLRGYLLTFLSEMLDKGEIGLLISIISQEWASDITVETCKVIRVIEQIVATNEENSLDGDVDDRIVCLQGLLANLCHQKACENLEYLGSYGREMDKCLDTYQKVFDHIGKHIWIYGACYDCMFQLEWYAEIIKHFVAKLNSGCTENSGRLYEPGIYTVISAHNHLTTYPDEFADMHKFIVIPSSAYILHKVAYAYMALSRKAKLVWLTNAYKIEANKVVIHLEKWVKRKCELYPEMDDDILYYLVGITAREVGNAAVMKNSFREAVKYGTTFKGFEVLNEPQFNDDHSGNGHGCDLAKARKKKYFHPYLKRNSTQSVRKLPAGLRFVGGNVRVGSYLHG